MNTNLVTAVQLIQAGDDQNASALLTITEKWSEAKTKKFIDDVKRQSKMIASASAEPVTTTAPAAEPVLVAPDYNEIAHAYQVLKQPGDVVEVRCPKTDKGTAAGVYNDGNELVKDTYELSAGTSDVQTTNVYWTLQALAPTECGNGFHTFVKKGEGISDEQVAGYRWLPIDFEPVMFELWG